MNSFFIPQLGSQIYSMAGMETKLHLNATEAGTYAGISANYSGAGFSGMRFKAIAMPQEGFDNWVKEAKASPGADPRGVRGTDQAQRAQPGRQVLLGASRHV